MDRYTPTVLRQLGRVFSRGTVAGLTEGKLLERFVVGNDEAAFAALVARHGPMVLGVCRRHLRDEQDVEDAFQATFLVLVRRASAIRDGDLVGHWLYGVAHRVAVRARANAARTHARESSDDVTIRAAAAPPSSDGDARELQAVIDEELGRLPETLRLPLVLCYLEGYTHEEAAERLRWPVGTVRSRMARGRDRLRRRLVRRGLVGDDAAMTTALAAVPVSSARLDAVVKTSLSFTSSQAAETSATVAAAALAKGVLNAMTIAKLKVVGTIGLAGVVALGAIQTYAVPFGSADGVPASDKSVQQPDDRQADLAKAVDQLQIELDKSARRNAELQTQVKSLRAQLEALRPAQPPAADKGAAAVDEAATKKNARSDLGQDAQGNPVRYRIDDDSFLLLSPKGDQAAVYGFGTDFDGNPVPHTSLVRLADEGAPPLTVTPVIGPGNVALRIVGPKVSRIAVYNTKARSWSSVELREPVDVAKPVQNGNSVFYVLGRRLYSFNLKSNRWDLWESATTTDGLVMGATPEKEGEYFTYNPRTHRWQHVDFRAIFNVPDPREKTKSP